jgi:fermentation-respiration switch protein FrsA (DUF1100 family)
VLIVIAIMAGIAFLTVRHLVHAYTYPAPDVPLSLSGLPPEARFVTVATADGWQIRGIEVPPRGDKPVLLVFHGNGAAASDTIDWFAPLIARGYGVVAADYRGYNGNPGRPSAAGLAADADAFYLRARALAAGRPVLVIGHSLGGGVAFELARTHKLDALVTIGAFSSLRDMAPRSLRLLVPDDYRNVSIVPQLDEPWFLVHGQRDTVVSPHNGTVLLAAARRSGREGAAFVLPDAGHVPPGRSVEAIVDQIEQWRAGGRIAPAAIPGMRVILFHGS